MPTTLESNSEWFAQQNLSDFAGQWVGVVDQKIVAVDRHLAAVTRALHEQAPGKTPFIARVPEGFLTV